MNLAKFDELMANCKPNELLQMRSEWRCFLEFADSYFKNRDILRPIVVEVGTYSGYQKALYTELLGAEYIGIDIKYGLPGIPNILGDSHNPKTVEILKDMLGGRQIDLLFIDGDHLYESVKMDYELYAPLTKHIIAFHDVCCRVNIHNPEVYRFWDEILEKELNTPLITFKKNDTWEWGWLMGIGVMVIGNGR